VVLGILTAYATARIPSRISKILHLLAMATGAVPGVVLGLSYVLFFKGTPLYGTIAILVMVNTVHFFASPYLMMQTSFSKVNPNLGAVASTLGIGKTRLLMEILLPQCGRTVREMFAYFFVNSMMTISAVSFLFNTDNKPIALMINQFEAQAQMEAAAVVSLLILAVNMAIKALVETRR
jgi:iron(III) transport system permease protein